MLTKKAMMSYARQMEPAPAQIRAARALLAWSQKVLAERSLVGLSTIKAIEAGTGRPTKANLSAIQRALEVAGIEFTEGGGIQPRAGERKAS